MTTALKSISLCLLPLTLCSGLCFASALISENEEGTKRRERREKSYRVKARHQKKADLLQDIREDIATHLEKYDAEEDIDDELLKKKKLIPSAKVTPRKKKRRKNQSTSQLKTPGTNSKIVEDHHAPAKKFLSVPSTPKKELKAKRRIPMAPFKIGSTIQDYWVQMEEENPRLYKVVGTTPFSKYRF